MCFDGTGRTDSVLIHLYGTAIAECVLLDRAQTFVQRRFWVHRLFREDIDHPRMEWYHHPALKGCSGWEVPAVNAAHCCTETETSVEA
jgi:hypothetical protein